MDFFFTISSKYLVSGIELLDILATSRFKSRFKEHYSGMNDPVFAESFRLVAMHDISRTKKKHF